MNDTGILQLMKTITNQITEIILMLEKEDVVQNC